MISEPAGEQPPLPRNTMDIKTSFNYVDPYGGLATISPFRMLVGLDDIALGLIRRIVDEELKHALTEDDNDAPEVQVCELTLKESFGDITFEYNGKRYRGLVREETEKAQ
jgi:hypothetical protein